MKAKRVALSVASVAACALPAGARAQGFGLNEIGSCAFARGFSATSAPCNDASAIFWNPGAAAGIKSRRLFERVAARQSDGVGA